GFFAVVRKEPIMPGLHQHDGPDLNFFVAARRGKERNFSLPGKDLQTLFYVVDGKHLPVKLPDDDIRNDPVVGAVPQVSSFHGFPAHKPQPSYLKNNPYMFGRDFRHITWRRITQSKTLRPSRDGEIFFSCATVASKSACGSHRSSTARTNRCKR